MDLKARELSFTMKEAERISAETVYGTELIRDNRTEARGVSEQGVKGNVCAWI